MENQRPDFATSSEGGGYWSVTLHIPSLIALVVVLLIFTRPLWDKGQQVTKETKITTITEQSQSPQEVEKKITNN